MLFRDEMNSFDEYVKQLQQEAKVLLGEKRYYNTKTNRNEKIKILKLEREESINKYVLEGIKSSHLYAETWAYKLKILALENDNIVLKGKIEQLEIKLKNNIEHFEADRKTIVEHFEADRKTIVEHFEADRNTLESKIEHFEADRKTIVEHFEADRKTIVEHFEADRNTLESKIEHFEADRNTLESKIEKIEIDRKNDKEDLERRFIEQMSYHIRNMTQPLIIENEDSYSERQRLHFQDSQISTQKEKIVMLNREINGHIEEKRKLRRDNVDLSRKDGRLQIGQIGFEIENFSKVRYLDGQGLKEEIDQQILDRFECDIDLLNTLKRYRNDIAHPSPISMDLEDIKNFLRDIYQLEQPGIQGEMSHMYQITLKVFDLKPLFTYILFSASSFKSPTYTTNPGQ
eukprot:TRINITY_DN517_c0_g2_i5.p1 TRINITY_DN517_c0_g2~~TRINITY_DN517_c0_g2_i5.p1  ORF type:complete len:402 (-),score=54.26 TRINITY_DN517_c0_g2_i5:73-1278(-)